LGFGIDRGHEDGHAFTWDRGRRIFRIGKS
jgi:hypothetical protein